MGKSEHLTDEELNDAIDRCGSTPAVMVAMLKKKQIGVLAEVRAHRQLRAALAEWATDLKLLGLQLATEAQVPGNEYAVTAWARSDCYIAAADKIRAIILAGGSRQ